MKAFEQFQPAPAVAKHTAHSFAPTATVPVIQTHLAPQNARTFRT